MATEQKEINTEFLAILGKTHLHPGGRVANQWLIENGDFNKDKKVLNIACNSGDTAIFLAKNFGCQVTGIDIDEASILVANKQKQEKDNKAIASLLHFMQGNIIKLPFKDNQFDIIANEVTLTLLPAEMKQQVLQEYLRVLKPNGLMLSHDIMLEAQNEAEDVLADLQKIIHTTIAPLTKIQWKNCFKQAGFRNVDTFSGEISLLSGKGLINYKGFAGTLKILGNTLKNNNPKSFIKLFKAFRDVDNKLEFIAICSQK